MEIGGLPLHPLVVHAAVVLAPLAALVAIVFAVVPRWRWLTRWPAVVTALIAAGSVFAARLSGEDLLDARPELAPLVAVHEDRGELLLWVTLGFAVVVLVAAWMLGGSTPLPNGRGARTSAVPIVDTVLAVLLVLAALAVLVQVVLTGDAGSRAVWG
ncbi:MAG TPA: DUF2231 domain-containing protein [Nocardioidaceae bacterium]|nr:DUF2231 domain-containing protein [Nocardioidaceae bacterium]